MLYAANVALFAAPSIAARNWRVLRARSRYWAWLAIGAGGIVGFFLLAWLDPGGVIEWWFD